MSDLGPNFYKKLVETASSLGMPPDQILNVMALESGFNPAAGSGSSAAGLIQIMPQYLGKLGFSGSAQDFRKIAPEEQLIYIERLIRKNINVLNGGRPFKSVTQYYVSNFLPACLTRQDIKNEDPSAILASKNPTEPHIPHNSVEYEKKVYAQNAGLDFNHDGNITYGDLQAKLLQAANGKLYKSQINNLQKYTGYETISTKPEMKSDQEYDQLINQMKKQVGSGEKMDFTQQVNVTDKTHIEPAKQNSGLGFTTPEIIQDVEDKVDQLLQVVRQSSDKSYKKLYKTHLKNNSFVIEVLANEHLDAIEFCRILCSALDEELLCRAYVHTDGTHVEVQGDINGPIVLCKNTIQQLSTSLSEVFKQATIKIGGIDIKTKVFINKESSYSELNVKSALINYRKFLLKFA